MLATTARWTHDGSSGGLAPAKVDGTIESVLYVQASTIASTASFAFQTAISSAGPWVTEGSTSISATSLATSLDRIRVTGPYPWMRPYFPTASTGTYTLMLMGVDD